MAANTNYKDHDTIARVVSIVNSQNRHLKIGEFKDVISHDEPGRVLVKTANGQMVVTHAGIEDVDHYKTVENYSKFMASTFTKD